MGISVEFLSAKEAADLIGVDESRVRQLCGAGKMPNSRKLNGRAWIVARSDAEAIRDSDRRPGPKPAKK